MELKTLYSAYLQNHLFIVSNTLKKILNKIQNAKFVIFLIMRSSISFIFSVKLFVCIYNLLLFTTYESKTALLILETSEFLPGPFG